MTNIELKGRGADELKETLRRLDATMDVNGVYYVSVLGDGFTARLLAAGRRLVGVAAEVDDEVFTGIDSASVIGRSLAGSGEGHYDREPCVDQDSRVEPRVQRLCKEHG